MYDKDVIDSSELIERLAELSDMETWEDYDYDEHAMLTAIIDHGSSYNTEWYRGVPLISENYFPEYIKSEYIAIGLVTDAILNSLSIDWGMTAEKAAMDYSEVDVNGNIYLFRVN